MEALVNDTLLSAKQRLARQIECSGRNQPIEALKADRWVANSLLQKAIRRSETKVAERAALTFLQQGGSAIWRRLMIIAFEDLGAASPDTVAMTVAASTDPSWRKNVGGDERVAIHLARILSEAPKSRSAEHLITTASCHPAFEDERRMVEVRSVAASLAAVELKTSSVLDRALAVRRSSRMGWMRSKSVAELSGLLKAFSDLGVPDELVEATGIAAVRTREAITLMVPLIWLGAGQLDATETDVPRSFAVDGLPVYALDKHTRAGREAIRMLVQHNAQVRECLARLVVPSQRNDAAYMAAFYADAAPLAHKLVWRGSEELETLGTEADLLKVGVTREGIAPLLQVFRENVDHLNKLRAHVLRNKKGFVDVSIALVTDDEGRA
jgi:hypothetical protein